MRDGVTRVYVQKPQKLEHYSGKRALRSSKLIRAQTSKRKLLPETGLTDPVQNLGVHQEFSFLYDTDFLRDSIP
jgi:hypothetical protein